MGKNNRHKKFLKQEKAKVHLKANKKLTRGQNITDTNFKTKKIVLQTQLSRTPGGDQPQTKRNLNLKELLSRTKHHNVNMKVEALCGLRELAMLYPEVLSTNLCNFLETSAARCTCEESPLVRQESLRLLHYVLDKVSAIQLEPFIAMLILHLSTGMTHLQRGIQEDALRMLDIVLAVAPDLVAQAAPILLPAFLEQISVKQTTGSGKRTLSLDLQSSNTSTHWRIKVLGRLHAMLSATIACSSVVDTTVTKPSEVHWSPTGSPYAPVYMWQHDKPCTIKGVFTTGPTDLRGQQNLFRDEAELKKYISILVPLLFEIWAEAGPTQKQQRDIGSLIPTDSAELLDCVLETMQHLWQHLELNEKGTDSQELTKWFRQSFKNDFIRHIVEHFPYYTTANPSKKIRRSKGQVPFEQEPETSCHNQNLAICHLFCCLCNKPSVKQAQAIHSYILSIFMLHYILQEGSGTHTLRLDFLCENVASLSYDKCFLTPLFGVPTPEMILVRQLYIFIRTLFCAESVSAGHRLTGQLVQVLECILMNERTQFETSSMSVRDLASSVVQSCLKSASNIQHSPFFNLLCDLSLNEISKNKCVYIPAQHSAYTKFIEELPSILTLPTITAKGLHTISKIAATQHPTLLQSVKLCLSRIVANLSVLTVDEEDQRSVQMAVLGVLYQASLWRVDILEVAARCLLDHQEQLQHLCQSFRQLMQLKLEKEPLCLVSQKLNSMPWFFEDCVASI